MGADVRARLGAVGRGVLRAWVGNAEPYCCAGASDASALVQSAERTIVYGGRALALTFQLLPLCRWADPGYYQGDDDDGPDPLEVALPGKDAFQAIRALPAEAGSAILFTHRWAEGAGTAATCVSCVGKPCCVTSRCACASASHRHIEALVSVCANGCC